VYGIWDLIWLSEWFSWTNTRTFVTAPARAGASADVVVCVVVGADVSAVPGWAPEDATADGVLPAVEHPDTTAARVHARATTRTIRSTSMRPVKRTR
jgi:hypothetical protein